MPSGTAETDSEDDDALGGEAEEDAFAALRRLFPGRILAVEPIETSDDAPTDGSSASLPLGSDRSDEAMPHDGEAGLAEVE